MADAKRPTGVEPVADANAVVNAYRLLGLKPGEPDADEIQRAINRARLVLEERCWGPDGEKYRKSLTALDRVEAILTDPKRKQAFDEQLPAQGDEASPAPPEVEDVPAEAVDVPAPVAAGAPEEPVPVPVTPSPPPRRRSILSWFTRLERDQKQKLAVTIVGMILTAVLVSRAVLMIPTPFPKPRVPPPVLKGSNLASPRMVPAPTKPTIAGLAVGVPKKIPGLEQVRDASEPTLSDDVKTIVFVRRLGEANNADLFMAVRGNPARPFGGPAPLKMCNTAATESSPTLARDGLELIFLRDGLPFVTTRLTLREKFRESEPLTIPNLDPTGGDRLTSVQLLADGLYLMIRWVPKGSRRSDPPSYLIAERVSRGAPFERTAPISSWFPRAPNVFSADTLREYAVTRNGLSIANRVGRDSEFGKPGLIQALMPSKVGAIDGLFWMSLREDVLVYVSPGVPPEEARREGASSKKEEDEEPSEAERYLWMVRFR